MLKPEYWVLSLSGGKDSTAMGLEWLNRHQLEPVSYPLDEVIYCDVGMEFPPMIEHVDKLEQIFTGAGIKFTRLKAEKSFEWFMFKELPEKRKREYNNVGRGWPFPMNRWCTGELKTNVIEKYFRQLNSEYRVFQMIGIAADEEYRLERKNNQSEFHIHPLIDWGWEEADCLKYCYDRGFDWGGLYELFPRVSCWCCPLQSLAELRNLRKHFPDLWEKLADMDHKAWNQFRRDFSVDQLEIRFQFEEERLAAGLPITTREFHKELKQRLAKQSIETQVYPSLPNYNYNQKGIHTDVHRGGT